MHYKTIATAMAAAGVVVAQRPANTPICDYYTTALLKNNTGANQYTLLTLLVNTVVIGNYTMPNVGVKVPGILASGTYNGENVNLLPYFNGELASSNRGGSSGVSVNFLDGGGAAPLMKNMPANDDKSQQYGFASMYEVHKFMDLDENELGYFIQQVALAAASFGVAQDDLKAVGTSLNQLFGLRCSPNATAIPEQGSQLQAICIADSCPISPNATCASYQPAVAPKNATADGMNATATGSTPASTVTPSTVPTAGAAVQGISLALFAGVIALCI
ncbi:uncharacterized protein ColSpa_10314 [Colletotrichum spaethianum]|uniref:Uncharacterized protein n=1 Tax=Colletotrichum spaethianum TaxID=700344 RepID=A0AA37USN3_9PEZI|nr:uncharacterized protein ColSpa_10314 [Colletotrichum spaethianum]GKT50133.1 hypothetical protein ColSpa_10314 [Colletotrichum spaethianum]